MRAGPPFPYLRWTGPLFPSARCRSLGQRRADVDRRSRHRMRGRRAARRGGTGARSPSRPARPYSRVAGDRMADGQQVGADLVRAAGLEPHPQQREVLEGLLDLEVRDRLARLVGLGRDARPHAPVAADRGVDRAGAGRRAALHEREVLAGDLAPRASCPSAPRGRPPCGRRPAGRRCRGRAGARSRAAAGRRRPRRGRASACASVPARARAPGARRRRPACRPRAGARPRRRSSNSASGTSGSGAGSLRGDRDPLARLDGVPLGPGGAVDQHQPGVDQPLRRGARAGGGGQEDVEALARVLGPDDELSGLHGVAAPPARRAG